VRWVLECEFSKNLRDTAVGATATVRRGQRTRSGDIFRGVSHSPACNAEFGHTAFDAQANQGRIVVLLIVSVIGFVVSLFLNFTVFDEFDACGEVPIPATETRQLPAGDVTISFHSGYPQGVRTDDAPIPIPDGLEVTLTSPSGAAPPAATDIPEGDRDCGTNTDSHDGHCTVKIAHIPQAGDYTVTTNADVASFPNPHLAFGHPSRFWLVT
jgi:hypothetical protein